MSLGKNWDQATAFAESYNQFCTPHGCTTAGA